MTATEKKLGSSGIRLRTYSDAELARVVLYGRGLRKQLAQGRRRRAAADGQRRIRQEPSPSPPPPDPETLEPWPHHPLALMGFFKQYIPAEGDPHDVLASAPRPPTKNGALGAPPFAAHSAIRFRDEAMDTLNPGWEPTVHVFQVTPALASKLNRALCPEMTALAAAEKGLSVSNRGGGFHSTQHLFRRGTPALLKLESLVSAAAAAAARAERQLAAGSDSDIGEASSQQPSSEGGGVAGGSSERDKPINSWVNVGGAGAYHGLHDHAGSIWSGVYYVSVPPDPPGSTSGGRIVFRTAVGGAVGKEQAETIGQKQDRPVGWCRFSVMDPDPGRLVLFPGWLPHAVTPLPLESEGGVRISISFNVGVEGDGEEKG